MCEVAPCMPRSHHDCTSGAVSVPGAIAQFLDEAMHDTMVKSLLHGSTKELVVAGHALVALMDASQLALMEVSDNPQVRLLLCSRKISVDSSYCCVISDEAMPLGAAACKAGGHAGTHWTCVELPLVSRA
jgi:hypothetical protein